jgi:hypothetical protein
VSGHNQIGIEADQVVHMAPEQVGLIDDVYDPKGTPQRREIEAAAD